MSPWLVVFLVAEMVAFAFYVGFYLRLRRSYPAAAEEVQRANPVATTVSLQRFVHRRKYAPLGDSRLSFWGDALRGHYWVTAGLSLAVGLVDVARSLVTGSPSL